MNREIEFRVWHGESQNMFPINERLHLQLQGKSWKVVDLDTGQLMSSWDKTSRNFLMQITGLCDYSGLEIYESDIVKNRIGNVFQVIWSKAEAAFMLDSIKTASGENELYFLGKQLRKYSVLQGRLDIIGNIHQNPNLLKPTI